MRGLHNLRLEMINSGVQIEVADDLRKLVDCDILVLATAGSTLALDDAPLTPGTLICDVARPADTSPELRARSDLFIFDGGLVTLPDPDIRFGAGNILGLPTGIQLSCLAETILLTLDRHFDDHGIGDDVTLDQVDFVMQLARRHGFGVSLPAETHPGFTKPNRSVTSDLPLRGEGQTLHG